MAVPDHDPNNQIFLQNPDEKLESLNKRAPLDTMPAGSFQSSNVHSGLYDFGERELFLRFKRDGPDAIYLYQNVPAQIWSGLVEADSKGSYVNQYIAFTYTYTELTSSSLPNNGQSMSSDLVRRFLTDP